MKTPLQPKSHTVLTRLSSSAYDQLMAAKGPLSMQAYTSSIIEKFLADEHNEGLVNEAITATDVAYEVAKNRLEVRQMLDRMEDFFDEKSRQQTADVHVIKLGLYETITAKFNAIERTIGNDVSTALKAATMQMHTMQRENLDQISRSHVTLENYVIARVEHVAGALYSALEQLESREQQMLSSASMHAAAIENAADTFHSHARHSEKRSAAERDQLLALINQLRSAVATRNEQMLSRFATQMENELARNRTAIENESMLIRSGVLGGIQKSYEQLGLLILNTTTHIERQILPRHIREIDAAAGEYTRDWHKSVANLRNVIDGLEAAQRHLNSQRDQQVEQLLGEAITDQYMG